MSATRITNNQIATSTITATNIQSGTLVGSLFNPNLTLNSNVTIAGNLSVAGNTTTINATNTYINDPLVVFNNGYGGSLTGYDIGIIVNRNLASLAPYGSVNTAWVWVEADQAFEAIATTSTGGNVQSINNSGFSNIKVGNATMTSVTISGAFNASGAITFTTATGGGLQALAIGNVTPGTGFFTQIGSTTSANLNTVTAASIQGVIGNVTPSSATFTSVTANTESVGGLQAVAIGNVTPGTGAFTTQTTGGLQATAIGNVTPGTAVFTTATTGGLQAVAIGNVTPGTAAFTTQTTGGLQAVAIGNVTPGTGAFTTVTGGSFQGIIGNVTPTTAFFTTANATNLYAATIGNVGTTLNGTLAATNVAGTVATANVALYNQIANLTNNQTYYVGFANVTGGNSTIGAVSTITVNPSTGTLAASAFSGGTGSFTTLGASGVVTFTNATQNTGASTGALQVTGGAYIGGNLWIGGNLNLTTSTTINSPSGIFTGNAAGFGALYAGITAGYVYQPQTVIQASINFNGYAQVNHQNINGGPLASGDFIVTANNGTANDTYIDMGMASSTYNYPGFPLIKPNDGYLLVTGNTTTGGGNLVITTGATNDIVFGPNNGEFGRITSGNVFIIKQTGAATNTTSGVLQVAGGVGIQGAVYAGSIQNTPIGSSTASTGAFTTVTLSSATNSTGVGTGSFYTPGGAAIAQDLYVGGNLYANSITTVQSQILSVTEPLLYLTGSNPYPYNFDIGFYSHFIGGPANVYAHTGLVRNYLDNDWYLFSNVGEPSGNVVNLASTNLIYDTLKLGTITLANVGNVINTSGSANIGSNVYAGNVNANQFYGTFNGTFSGSIVGTPVAANVAYFLNESTTSTNATYYPLFGNANATGNTATFINTSYNFNPSTGTLAATTFSGAVSATTIVASSTLNVTGATTLTTATTGGLQAVAIGNVTPGTGVFTTGTFNTISTGGLQAVAIGNVTPGTGAFTTLTGGSFQGIIGNATPTTAFFTTANATNVYAATIGNVGTTLNGTLAATNIAGTVATANVAYYDNVATTSTNATYYVEFVNAASGNVATYTNSALNFNPSTGALYATSFNGVGTFSTATTTSTFQASGAIIAASGASSTSPSTGALQVQGGAGITGNLIVGTQLNYVPANAPVQVGFNINGYSQFSIQNANAGNNASTDIAAVANNGSDNDTYVDMGIVSSTYSQSAYSLYNPNDGYLIVAGNTTTGGGNLILNTYQKNDIIFATGGTTAKFEVARITSGNVVVVKSTNNNTLSANTGALQVWGGASISGNTYVGASSTQVGGAVFNSGRASAGTSGSANQNAVIVQGVNDSTLVYAKPLTAYDAVIIGGNAASTSFAQGAKFIVNSTDSMILPTGTNAQRPSSSGGTDTTGMLRFNTTAGSIEWYNGSAWSTASTSFTVIGDSQYTGTGSQTVFTLPSSQTTNSCIVSINGVVQIPTLAYSVSGTSLTFTEAPLTTDVIDVRMITTTSTVTGLSDTSGYNQVIVSNVGVQFTTGTSSPTLQYSINTSGAIASTVPNVTISTSGTPTTVDSFFANTYSTAKYIITSTLGTVKEATEVLVISNGTVANAVTYGTINTAGNSLVSWSATMSGNVVNLQGTTTNNSTIVRMTKQYNAI